MRNSADESIWCPILYEKLPDFCFNCGIIGHSHRECQVSQSDPRLSGGANYGDWLRATILKKSTLPRWKEGRPK